MDFPLTFGEWLNRRRKELDLTQAELAERASCSVNTLRKIEAGARRPSKQLAGLLAKQLEIPPENQTTFIRVARGELNLERLGPAASIRSTGLSTGPIPFPPRISLPFQPTQLIGREAELTVLAQLLQDPQCSLLTIAGLGGIGKTRLAVETARHSKELFPDGIWFVPLVSVYSPLQIVPAIASALEFKFQDPTNPQAQLLRYLHPKRALLVLDNAEHLLEGVEAFTEILKGCPQVKLLVTSRERLNLLSEWVFDLKGLPVPPSDQVEKFEAYSSVALFLQSARRVRVGFEMGEAERRWVLKICQIMGGMPLGIELSAAWVGLLSCEEIAKEIEHNLDFLSVSMRDLPERHRSLRATLDHSWKLLTPEEKLILSRLSVFQGSFSREAAQAICGASLAVLSSLRNKTLLYRKDQKSYGLHEIIRQYAEQKLSEEPDENERVKDQHAAYYIQRLSEWEKTLKSSRQVKTLNEMAQVIDNLSLGWQHMVASCQPRNGKSNQLCADLLHRALFSLSLFYEIRCRSWEAITLFSTSVEYLKSVQSEFEKTEDRSSFISILGHITAYLGLHHDYVLQFGEARRYLEEALRLLEENHSKVEKAQAQIMLAALDYRQGQIKRSEILREQSRDVFREAGESWWYLLSLIHLARTYLSLGRFQESEALYQEGFQLIEPGDLRLELTLRIGFAYARYLQNDYTGAEQLMQDNLELGRQLGNHLMIANSYFNLGKVALSTNRVELAEKYLQESIKLLSDFGESDDLAHSLLYQGKCFVTRLDIEAARQKFRQVIEIGRTLDMFYLVYWGLANIARTYLDEGQTGKALEISLALRHCHTEYKIVQDEIDCLLADLQAVLPEGQMGASTSAQTRRT